MPERAIAMDWNWRSHSTGMRDHNRPDYAQVLDGQVVSPMQAPTRRWRDEPSLMQFLRSL
jgi:hypothetical protein